MEQEQSIYSAPNAELNEKEEIFEPEPASKGKRILNLIIDYIGFLALSFLIGVLGQIPALEGLVEGFFSLPDAMLGFVVFLIYYPPLEIIFGRTLGKLVTGTKVVDEKGKKPKAIQILIRTFCRFIPFEAFSFLGDTGRGWHDSIPNVYVISVRK